MEFSFEDDDLRRLYCEASFLSAHGPDVTRAFRRVVQLIAAATDERDLYAMKSRRFEKLKGDRSHQHSLRLNKQWRLIVELEGKGSSKHVRIVEIVDYH